MELYKVTNAVISDGVTKFKCVKMLKSIGYTGSVRELLDLVSRIVDEGIIINGDHLPIFSTAFNYNFELADTDIIERLRLEDEDKKMNEANQWFQNLSSKEQAFVNILARGYIPIA